MKERPTVEPWTLGAAYERCRQLHARHGRTYYLATLLLPRWKRRHVHALYGFTRYADEIVDDLDSTLDRAGQAAALGAWGERLFAGLRGQPCQDPILPAVLHTVRAFDLDVADFERFLHSMAMVATGPTPLSGFLLRLGLHSGTGRPVLSWAGPARRIILSGRQHPRRCGPSR